MRPVRSSKESLHGAAESAEDEGTEDHDHQRGERAEHGEQHE
ncbi:MAG: hypothetical protein QOI95_4446 [Acidimicrobiaceae bacterium]